MFPELIFNCKIIYDVTKTGIKYSSIKKKKLMTDLHKNN